MFLTFFFFVFLVELNYLQFLYDSGVENIFAMYEEDATDTGLTTDDFNWGSATFHKMGRQKVDLAATFTSFGLDLCLCDVDTVWINGKKRIVFYIKSLTKAYSTLAPSFSFRFPSVI